MSEQATESRMCAAPEDWCDGPASPPEFCQIVTTVCPTTADEQTCITFFTCGPSRIRLATTSWHYDDCMNDPTQQGAFYYEQITGSWGEVEICFDEVGDHFLVEVDCSNSLRCFVFDNQCSP